MKSVLVFLVFGLLGGLITLFGGLVGRVEISVLLLRSLVATVISALTWLILFVLLSKSLFADTDLFALISPPQTTQNRQKNYSGRPAFRFGKRRKPAEPKADAEKDGSSFAFAAAEDANEIAGADSVDELTPPDPNFGNGAPNNAPLVEDIGKRMKEIDAEKLAQMVRYSINEEK